jgi:hypothetical protein
MYIYQADLWCNRCGRDIQADINREMNDGTRAVMEGWQLGDSDNFPQWESEEGQRSDSPDHCGAHGDCLDAITLPGGTKIGALLHDGLTDDGVSYIVNEMEAAFENAITDRHKLECLDYWRLAFSDYFEGDDQEPVSLFRGYIKGFHAAQNMAVPR